MPAMAVVAVPFILDSMAQTVEKTEISATLKRWALVFEVLGDSIRRFNEILEEAMRNCLLSETSEEFRK